MGKQLFILEVNGSRNHSWQGNLEWINGHKQESFRSMLELLHLIDSVMEKGREETAQDEVREMRGKA